MKSILFIGLGCLVLTGCMSPIGKKDFACPNEKKGGVCAGPRDIHELTNTRPNLENLANEGAYSGYVITTDKKGRTTAVRQEARKETLSAGDRARLVSSGSSDTVYEPRDHTQHGVGNYQPATVIPQIRADNHSSDGFRSWPNATEPLAPEPLAVLKPAKVMRILVASYKDGRGNLNMPGYVFVQVEPETWSFGEAANLRPQRVVPLQIRERANNENDARRHRQQGVSPLEHQSRGNGG